MEFKITYNIKNVKTEIKEDDLNIKSYEIWINGELHNKVECGFFPVRDAAYTDPDTYEVKYNTDPKFLEEEVVKGHPYTIQETMAAAIWPK